MLSRDVGERPVHEDSHRALMHYELLAAVSERLASSLDPAVTVQAIPDAVVPAFADWCVVDLLRDDRSLETVARTHRDPRLTELIGQLRLRYPPSAGTDSPHAIYRAIDRAETICEVVSRRDLERRARDAKHLALLEELGIGSHIVARVAIRGRIIGAVSLVRRPDRPAYDEVDVTTAEGVARRAGVAIDNSQLYRSAQQAIEMRDRFLAVASHELRTPLSVVYGHWELLARWLRTGPGLADGPHAEKIRTSLDRLGRGVDQLRRLVEELLDVSRLAGGTMELNRSPADLVAIVRQSVDDASSSVRAGRLRLDVPDRPVVGNWDAARLGQVVDNLLLNALKYSPEDQGIEVSLGIGDGIACLHITDRGIGIPPGELESIFEPFSRATNASSQHFPGLGVGLAVSREIVGRMGGRMWAESEGEDRGSTFHVELPMRSGAEADAEAEK